MTLSKAQQELVNLMGRGWVLVSFKSVSRYFILISGVNQKIITTKQFNCLCRRGLIIFKERCGMDNHYELTELGKQHIKENGQ